MTRRTLAAFASMAALIGSTLASASAWAQARAVDNKPATAAPAPAAPSPTPAAGGATSGVSSGDPIVFNLTDGSIVTGRLEIKEIPVKTSFGDLSVPVEQILSLTPGSESRPDFAGNIRELVNKLGAPDAADRDKAQSALKAMGPSIANELKRAGEAAEGDDPERKLRIRAIMDEFTEAASEDDAKPVMSIPKLDTLETAEFTIAGRVVPKTFTIASAYGPLTVKLSDIRRAQRNIVKGKEETRKSIAVEGTNLMPNNMRNTGITLAKGDKVTITADGTITLTPWGNEAISTPDGSMNYGWYMQGQIPTGGLGGRIGNSGSIFKVGARSTFTAQANGTLFLGIGMQANMGAMALPGRYNVKIKVEPKP